MDKEIINKVLELAAYKKQLESLREVLCVNGAERITISNNKGLCRKFDGEVLLKLRLALSKMEIELEAEFEKL